MMTELEKYYNKFNEEKRLTSRHGQVEFITSMKYIHKYLPVDKSAKILDVGAGTGRYSVQLAEEGYDVTAVELVKYNLGILKKKNSAVKAYQGNAMKLSRFQDKEFDLILIFGPMYHLYSKEDKVKALTEAKRVLKDEGVILVAYCMISADGPSDYMRPVLNAMDEKTFQTFIEYHLSTCERLELVGAGSHTVDIIRKRDNKKHE